MKQKVSCCRHRPLKQQHQEKKNVHASHQKWITLTDWYPTGQFWAVWEILIQVQLYFVLCLVSPFVCRCAHLRCPTWAKVFHFAWNAKWPMSMAASSHYLPLNSSKPSIQNPFRGRCYVTDLKSLSRGDSPPTTSISWASYSVMPTEAWSERGRSLHLPLPVESSGEATRPWEDGCWLQATQDRVGGLRERGRQTEEAEGQVGDWKELSVFLEAACTSSKSWMTWWHLVQFDNV